MSIYYIYLLHRNTNYSTILQCATANPDGGKRALVIGGGIANFTDVAATFNGIIRALKEKVSMFIHCFLLLYSELIYLNNLYLFAL